MEEGHKCGNYIEIFPTHLQAPLLAYNHFVESIFVLNNWQSKAQGLIKGPGAVESDQTQSASVDSGLAGSNPTLREKREHIYRYE